MNKNFSDEKLDQILERLVKDSMLNDETVDEIADSPKLWWNVQSRIRSEKENLNKGWLQPWLNWQTVGFASLILVFCGGLFWYENLRENQFSADVTPIVLPENETPEIAESFTIETPKSVDKISLPNRPTSQKIISAKKILPKKDLKREVSAKPQQAKLTPKPAPKTEEIKTEFIALSFSPAPESGQILKVKVPRSMMVSLGVTSNVGNVSELVNAEVLVGDDGLARAIRFIQ